MFTTLLLQRLIRFSATAAVFIALLQSAGDASAQTREFTGEVSQISASRVVVRNRMDDRIAFERGSDTSVIGAVERWEAIESRDRITVHWSLRDKPRRARRVTVFPRR